MHELMTSFQGSKCIKESWSFLWCRSFCWWGLILREKWRSVWAHDKREYFALIKINLRWKNSFVFIQRKFQHWRFEWIFEKFVNVILSLKIIFERKIAINIQKIRRQKLSWCEGKCSNRYNLQQIDK